MVADSKYLALPDAEPARFARNFVTTAVCELRFPTLFELEADPPPRDFVKAIRQAYPIHAINRQVSVNATGTSEHLVHTFGGGKSAGWTVSLGAAAVTLETVSYHSFDDFLKRVEMIVNAAGLVIDSSFFTRIGLRYQNAIPGIGSDICQWVNPALVAALGSGVFGDAQEYSGRMSGLIAEGSGFTLMHGIGMDKKGKTSYILDIDTYSENIELVESLAVLKDLHRQSYNVFSWCAGEKAWDYLGKNLKDSK